MDNNLINDICQGQERDLESQNPAHAGFCDSIILLPKL